MSETTRTTYSPEDWTESDTQKAKEIWEEYQKTHDVSDRKGQAAGIDPKTGEIWFGESALDIVDLRESQGLNSLLFFVRVGYPTYWRKGGRQ